MTGAGQMDGILEWLAKGNFLTWRIITRYFIYNIYSVIYLLCVVFFIYVPF